MVVPNKARVYRRRSRAQLHSKSVKVGKLQQGRSRGKGSRVGDDLVEAFEEMAKHLRGEIELEAHNLPDSAMTPAQIRTIRLKVAWSAAPRLLRQAPNIPLTASAPLSLAFMPEGVIVSL